MTAKTYDELALIGADQLAQTIYNTCCKRDKTDLARAEANGMLAKHELRDGAVYAGFCRNATLAIWRADRQRFEYERTKFGARFPEDVPHPADDDGYDVFVPVLCMRGET